jgi:hypothetical protein
MKLQDKSQSKQIVWKSTYLNTTEFLSLDIGETIRAEGFIAGEAKGSPLHVHYQLVLDHAWNLESIKITEKTDCQKTISMHRDESGQWYKNKVHVPEYDHCTDVDIIYTPFTNSLPINRLNLAEGETGEVEVIYFNLPDWKVEHVSQRYTRLGIRHYKYENLTSGFSTILEVDEYGLVIDYPGIWERIISDGEKEQADIQKQSNRFADTLISETADSEISDTEDIYRRLIGSWDLKVIDYYPDGSITIQESEWHFSRVLNGRAIQDVLITKKHLQKHEDENIQRVRYGTSLRAYDPAEKGWIFTWINPVSGACDKLRAIQEGDQIVQTGHDADGNLMRWVFTDITRNTFRWVGERSIDDGKNWILEAEFFATRQK